MNTIINWERQLWSFINDMQIDDLVAMPSKSRSVIYFGKVTGDYKYEPNNPVGFRHTRPVQWLTDIPRDNIDQDLLNSFRSLVTVCKIQRNDAENRIIALLDGKPFSTPDSGVETQTDIEADQNQDVFIAFDLLLDELEQVIPELNSQIGELTAEKKFDQAQTVLDKAKQITAIQQKVRTLREEWQTLFPSVPEPRKPKLMFKEGQAITQEELRIPILQALVTLGGISHLRTVFEKLEETIGDQFTEIDWQYLPTNKKDIRWKSKVRWERLKMVKEGLLDSKTPHGIWEITPLGRQVLEESKKIV